MITNRIIQNIIHIQPHHLVNVNKSVLDIITNLEKVARDDGSVTLEIDGINSVSNGLISRSCTSISCMVDYNVKQINVKEGMILTYPISRFEQDCIMVDIQDRVQIMIHTPDIKKYKLHQKITFEIIAIRNKGGLIMAVGGLK